MKKIISILILFAFVLTGFAGCFSYTEETTTLAETTDETTTAEETTTEETTEKETTTQKPTTTRKETTTKKNIGSVKVTTTRKITTTKKPTTTLPSTERLPVDLSDVICDEIDPEKPMVALTFDDGPSAHTPRLLNIFKKHGGKGTFFVVGNMLENNKLVVKRMADEGHEIASHSWSHPDLSLLSLEKSQKEIQKTHEKIYEITGMYPKIIRPPYGAYNDTVRYAAYTCNEAIVTWSVDTLDWKTRNAKAVYYSVMNSVSDGAIILCHDLHGTTVDAMEKVIPALIEEGYQLVTVSQLLSLRKGEIVAGGVYYRG